MGQVTVTAGGGLGDNNQTRPAPAGAVGSPAPGAGGRVHRQAGRGSSDDCEVGVPKDLAWQCSKRDCLITFGNREQLWNVRSRVVVAIAGLRGGERAGARASQMDCGASDAATAAGGQPYSQAGRSSGTNREVRVPKVFARQRGEGYRLAALGH